MVNPRIAAHDLHLGDDHVFILNRQPVASFNSQIRSGGRREYAHIRIQRHAPVVRRSAVNRLCSSGELISGRSIRGLAALLTSASVVRRRLI